MLCSCPFQGKILLAIDVKSRLILSNRVFQVALPISIQPFAISDTQVIVRLCPFCREVLLRVNMEGSLETGDGLFRIGLLIPGL